MTRLLVDIISRIVASLGADGIEWLLRYFWHWPGAT